MKDEDEFMGCAGPGASEQTADGSLEKGVVGFPALPWETAGSVISSGCVEISEYPFFIHWLKERVDCLHSRGSHCLQCLSMGFLLKT